jgi:hypothetical protein
LRKQILGREFEMGDVHRKSMEQGLEKFL